MFISATATGSGVPWLRAWLGMFQLLQLIQLPLRASIQGDLDQIEQINNYETVINVHDVMKQWEWRVLEYVGYSVQVMIAIGCGVFTLIPVSAMSNGVTINQCWSCLSKHVVLVQAGDVTPMYLKHTCVAACLLVLARLVWAIYWICSMFM